MATLISIPVSFAFSLAAAHSLPHIHLSRSSEPPYSQLDTKMPSVSIKKVHQRVPHRACLFLSKNLLIPSSAFGDLDIFLWSPAKHSSVIPDKLRQAFIPDFRRGLCHILVVAQHQPPRGSCKPQSLLRHCKRPHTHSAFRPSDGTENTHIFLFRQLPMVNDLRKFSLYPATHFINFWHLRSDIHNTLKKLPPTRTTEDIIK